MVISKMLRGTIFLFPCFFLIMCLNPASSNENAIRIELKEEIGNYDEIISSLFQLNTKKIKDKVYLVYKVKNTESFIQILKQLPYISKVNGNKIEPERKQKELKRIFIKFRKNMDEDLKIKFEDFFYLKEKKYFNVLDGYSYSVTGTIDIDFLINYIKTFYFIIHIEEDYEVKMF
jgi:hypothetical protein